MKRLRFRFVQLLLRYSTASILSLAVFALPGAQLKARSCSTDAIISNLLQADSSYQHLFTRYVCVGAQILSTLSDQSAQGWRYEWTPTTGLSNPKAANTVIQVSQSILYVRRATKPDGLFVFDTLQFYVREVAPVLFATLDSVCENTALTIGIVRDQSEDQTFVWNVSTASGSSIGAILSGQETNVIQVQWNGEGRGRVEVRVAYPESGCVTQGQQTISIVSAKKPVIVSSSEVLCATQSVTLSARDEARTYLWSTGERTRSISVTAPGLYTLRCVSLDGCTSTDGSFEVRRSSTVQPVIQGEHSLCEGSSIQLSCVGSYSQYQWSNGNVGPSIVVDKAGSYSVWVSGDDGCVRRSEEHRVSDLSSALSYATTIELEESSHPGRATGKWLLTNSGERTVRIESIEQVSQSKDVEFSSIAFPLILEPSQSIEILLSVAEGSEVDVARTVRIRCSSPCLSTSQAALLLQMQPRKSLARFEAPEVVVAQCGQNLNYDLKLSVSNVDATRLANASLAFEIECDASVFDVIGIDEGELLSDRIFGSKRRVQLKVHPSQWSSDATTGVRIKGLVLASMKKQTEVTIKQVAFEGDLVGTEVLTKSGSIVLKEHCFGSDISLLSVPVTAMTIGPNPLRHDLHVWIENCQEGEYVCTLRALDGSLVREQRFRASEAEARELLFDSDGVAEGTFFVVLNGPSGQQVQNVTLLR